MFEILFLRQKMERYYAMYLFSLEKVRDCQQESYYLNGWDPLYSYVQPFYFLKNDFSPNLSIGTLGLLFRRKVLSGSKYRCWNWRASVEDAAWLAETRSCVGGRRWRKGVEIGESVASSSKSGLREKRGRLHRHHRRVVGIGEAKIRVSLSGG